MSEHHHYARLSIVIPVYNEQATLPLVVQKVIDVVPHLFEVIVVDDCSTDKTGEIANQLAQRHPQIRVARHDRNLGKTAALRTGFALTTGDIVIVQDADLEYDPAEISSVIQPIIDGHADVVYGSRFLVKRAARVLYFYHYLGNKVLTFTSNLLTNLNMTDVETGYKAFKGHIVRSMIIKSSGFGFEIEATAKIAKLGCPIYEVPISYYGRTYEDGKKIRARDSIWALWFILRFNLFCGMRSSFREIPKENVPASNHLVSEPVGLSETVTSKQPL
jgi:glycosyltransferase involved in cell wall biosynthesis